MEGTRERHERSFRRREVNELEEARDTFWAKIDAYINDSKSCKYDKKMGA